MDTLIEIVLTARKENLETMIFFSSLISGITIAFVIISILDKEFTRRQTLFLTGISILFIGICLVLEHSDNKFILLKESIANSIEENISIYDLEINTPTIFSEIDSNYCLFKNETEKCYYFTMEEQKYIISLSMEQVKEIDGEYKISYYDLPPAQTKFIFENVMDLPAGEEEVSYKEAKIVKTIFIK